MMSDEEAKAVQEIAKTTKAALPLAEKFGAFVARVIGGPLEQGMGIVEDQIKFRRWERQLRMMKAADELLESLGIQNSIKPVPMKIAIPLLYAATLEESDELQDRWARLLVNALDPHSQSEVTRALISVLEDFGAMEAKLLDVIVAQSNDDGIITAGLPDKVLINSPNEPMPMPPDNVALALWNLVRLGCVTSAMTWGGGATIAQVYPTALGRELVRACQVRSR